MEGKFSQGFSAAMLYLLVFVCMSLLVTWPMMYLWNACMPAMFGLPVVSDYWTMAAFVLMWTSFLRPNAAHLSAVKGKVKYE